MQEYRKNLGKVSLTAEGAWTKGKSFDILSIVYDEHTLHGFISKQYVPEGVDLYNKEYWMPFNVSGYSDNNIIILSEKTSETTIKAYTLEEAINSVAAVGRRPGMILGFYNENTDRLDIGGRWEIWQFNSTTISEWEDIAHWQNIYYSFNKFVGWYRDVESLKKYNPFPEIGCYAYVGTEFNEATIYRCDTKFIWTDTTQHAWDYIKVVVQGNVTIGENGNWFNNGVDTGIPASIKGENGKTPVFRQYDNTIQYSFDNVNWITISDKVAAWFRWNATTGDTQANNVGRIQISRDNVTWTNLSGDIINKLHISRYIGADESLPTSGIAEGTIYAKGPYYAEDDTLNDNPIYRLWVYAWKGDTLAWQDNGEFQSIAAGIVQEIGNSETEVMSQNIVSNSLSKIGNDLIINEVISSNDGALKYISCNLKKGIPYYFLFIGNYNYIAVSLDKEDLIEYQTFYPKSNIISIITPENNYTRIKLFASYKDESEINIYASNSFITLDNIINKNNIVTINNLLNNKVNEISDTITSVNSKYIKKYSALSNNKFAHYLKTIKEISLVPKGFAQNHIFGINVLSTSHNGDGIYRLWIQDITANVAVGSYNINPEDVSQKEDVIITEDNAYCRWFARINFKYLEDLGLELTWGVNEVAIINSDINSQSQHDDLKFNGKTIWWCGTSIPEGGYPKIVGDILQANVINVAKGSSSARIGRSDISENDPYGWTNVPYDAVLYSLTMKLSEKQELIDNWSKWRTIVANNYAGSPPDVLSEDMKSLILECSYENKLIPYLDGTNITPDIFVIDHGYNDWIGTIEGGSIVYDRNPSTIDDRNTYIGAINFIIRTIYSYKPKAKIVIIGHYENKTDHRAERICKAQEFIANYWGIPIVKTWELSGITNATILTDGYWSDGKWYDHGYSEGKRELSSLMIWTPDGTHPGADKTGKANKHLASIYAAQLFNMGHQ